MAIIDVNIKFQELQDIPIRMTPTGEGGGSYSDLSDKPRINEEIVEGVKEGKDYSLQDRLIPGEGIEIIDNGDHTATIKATGGGGEDKFFTFTQTTPAQEWVIQHNLDKFPSVTIVDSAGSVVIGDITYIDKDNVKLTFKGAFSGKAYLN